MLNSNTSSTLCQITLWSTTAPAWEPVPATRWRWRRTASKCASPALTSAPKVHNWITVSGVLVFWEDCSFNCSWGIFLVYFEETLRTTFAIWSTSGPHLMMPISTRVIKFSKLLNIVCIIGCILLYHYIFKSYFKLSSPQEDSICCKLLRTVPSISIKHHFCGMEIRDNNLTRSTVQLKQKSDCLKNVTPSWT